MLWFWDLLAAVSQLCGPPTGACCKWMLSLVVPYLAGSWEQVWLTAWQVWVCWTLPKAGHCWCLQAAALWTDCQALVRLTVSHVGWSGTALWLALLGQVDRVLAHLFCLHIATHCLSCTFFVPQWDMYSPNYSSLVTLLVRHSTQA
jgi:hypothetical protein